MCGAPPSNAQAPAWQEMRVLLAYSLRSDRSNWPSLLQSICAISPGVPSAHMAQPAALPGQTGRLQPAQACLRPQQQRLAAPAGRGGVRMGHSRRLMVAAAEPPQERPAAPSASPNPGPRL
jgi:hypothetical protein